MWRHLYYFTFFIRRPYRPDLLKIDDSDYTESSGSGSASAFVRSYQ